MYGRVRDAAERGASEAKKKKNPIAVYRLLTWDCAAGDFQSLPGKFLLCHVSTATCGTDVFALSAPGLTHFLVKVEFQTNTTLQILKSLVVFFRSHLVDGLQKITGSQLDPIQANANKYQSMCQTGMERHL